MSDLELKSALSEMHAEIEKKMQAVTEQSETKGKEYKQSITDLDAAIKSLKDEMTDLAQKHATPVEVIEAKSFGQQVLESDSIKSFISGEATRGRVEIKNTIVNSGHNTSVYDQLSGAVAGAFRRLTVMPTIMQGSASSNSIEYSKESSWVNGAASQVEGAAKAESTLTFAEVSAPVRTIAHFLRVSKQALSDSTFLASYIEMRCVMA